MELTFITLCHIFAAFMDPRDFIKQRFRPPQPPRIAHVPKDAHTVALFIGAREQLNAWGYLMQKLETLGIPSVILTTGAFRRRGARHARRLKRLQEQIQSLYRVRPRIDTFILIGHQDGGLYAIEAIGSDAELDGLTIRAATLGTDFRKMHLDYRRDIPLLCLMGADDKRTPPRHGFHPDSHHRTVDGTNEQILFNTDAVSDLAAFCTEEIPGERPFGHRVRSSEIAWNFRRESVFHTEYGRPTPENDNGMYVAS